MKRQLHGTHHSVGRKHLHRYVSEVEFKYNNRGLSDGERTIKLIQAAAQRRLMYKDQTATRDGGRPLRVRPPPSLRQEGFMKKEPCASNPYFRRLAEVCTWRTGLISPLIRMGDGARR